MPRKEHIVEKEELVVVDYKCSEDCMFSVLWNLELLQNMHAWTEKKVWALYIFMYISVYV